MSSQAGDGHDDWDAAFAAKTIPAGLGLPPGGTAPRGQSPCRHVLALVPRHHDSLNFLGEIASLSGRNDAALALIGDAIKLKPSEPRYHYDFGTTLISEGRLEEAVAHLRKAVRKKPDFAAAHSNFWGRTVQARAVGADGGGLPGSAAGGRACRRASGLR